MEGLSQEDIKQLTGNAKDILIRLDKVDGILQQLKSEIERSFQESNVPSPLKTRREFCKLLKVSMTTLDKMIAEGKIKAFKVGGKSVRIHEDQLKSILSN